MSTKSIAVIGGGYSGTSLAINLKRLAQTPITIYLIDRSPQSARGAAYSTPYPFHLLNVSAKQMSAFPAQAQDFVNWLEGDSEAQQLLHQDQAIGEQFAPRLCYGNYLETRYEEALQLDSPVEIKAIKNEVINISRKQQFQLTLADGEIISSDQCVLALGNSAPSNLLKRFIDTDNPAVCNNPWQYTALEQINSENTVFIIGTGLTMVDAVLTLHRQAHRGKIIGLSHHGLLPRAHTLYQQAFKRDSAKLPSKLEQVFHQVRIEMTEFDGDWRAVIDSLRGDSQRLWQGFSLTEKQRFMRHVRAYWDVHRHRIAPEIAEELQTMQTRGQLEIVAAKLLEVKSAGNQFIVISETRRHSQTQTWRVDNLINCSGPNANIETMQHPLFTSLREQGLIHADPLKLGIFCDERGKIQDGLYTLGPPCKGVLWEIVAVPDIRVHSLALAKELMAN